MIKKVAFALLAVVALKTGASAQILTTFTAESVPNTTGTTVAVSTAGSPLTVGPYAAEINNLQNSGTANLTAFHSGTAFPTSVTTYSTPAGQSSAKSFSANNWSTGDYFQFALSNTLGSSAITNFGVSVGVMGSSTGPRDFVFQYSLDNSTYVNVSAYAVTGSFFTQTFSLSGIAALNESPTTVYLRLTDTGTTSVGGATVATAGTSRFDNFTVGTLVPEPSSYICMIGGLGALALIIRRRRAV